MGKQKLKGKDLRKIGYKSNEAISLAINIIAKHFKYIENSKKLNILADVAKNPQNYLNDVVLSPLAYQFVEVVEDQSFEIYQANEHPKDYNIFGGKYIDDNTRVQMDTAMKLPVSIKGALMPDAHVGYGLPIGGVLATNNEVIPFAVGMDIGCRMALSIFDVNMNYANKYSYLLKTSLKENTHFGKKIPKWDRLDHEILERSEFKTIGLFKNYEKKAQTQLGTSGSGNHFVEFGEVILEEGNKLNIKAGSYLGLLSHSGSRGMGAMIAEYYSQIAMQKCKLPKGFQHLAWLDLDKEEGIEYWLAMNLAGDYAKANHDLIHSRISKAIGVKSLIKVENHHNFAWKEKQNNGEELIVHRKGATPAKQGELGIIPGSMTAAGYIVSGKGNEKSLSSASHGAGRVLSRTKAKNSITKSEVSKYLRSKGVTLIGGGVDEAPMVYKDIDAVMNGQKELVNIEGRFIPKIVRMDKN